jgi:hypothetical protein
MPSVPPYLPITVEKSIGLVVFKFTFDYSQERNRFPVSQTPRKCFGRTDMLEGVRIIFPTLDTSTLL